MNSRWHTTMLGNLCKTGSGGTPLKEKKEYYDGGAIPWLMSGEVSQGEVREATNFITQRGLENSAAKIFPKDTILVAMYGATAGQVGILRFEAATNQAVCGILPSKHFVPEFLFYLMLSRKDELVAQAAGNAQPNISQIKIRNTDVPIVPLPEQQRIVGILEKAFDGVATAKANAEKNLQNARALFECRLQSAFMNRDKGWVEATIGELCDIKHGFAFDGAEFSNDVPADRPLVITPGNFTEDGRLIFNDRNTKRCSGDAPAGYRFNVGDLVVVMTDLSSKMKILGKPAFVETDEVLHNQRIGRVVFSNDRVEKRLLYYFMMTEGFLKSIKGSATGTMVKHTAPKRILSNVIPFPANRKEQREIVGKLDALREETKHFAELYVRKLEALEALKKSLLHQAFIGEL